MRLNPADARGLELQGSHSYTGAPVYKDPRTQLEFVGICVAADAAALDIDAVDVSEHKKMPVTIEQTEKMYLEGVLDDLTFGEMSAAGQTPGALAGLPGLRSKKLPQYRPGHRELHKQQSPGAWNEDNTLKRCTIIPMPAHKADEISAVGFHECHLDHSAPLTSDEYRGTAAVDDKGFGMAMLGMFFLCCDALTATRYLGCMQDASDAQVKRTTSSHNKSEMRA
jgi:hypothetical protein